MHATPSRATRLLAACVLLAGCEPAPQSPAPALELEFPARVQEPLATLAARVPLAPGQDFRVEELGRSEHTSHHVGAIRTGEALHRHARHDQLVLLVRGHGSMRVGGEIRPIVEGTVTFLPRGVPHAFTNGGIEPAIAYLMYAPPYDGADRVEVGEADAPGPGAARGR
jgi:mannose-6-phosphate isomerase-like protein (cupin superfamily)